MSNKNTFLNGANAPYVAELFFKFKQDSKSVDSSWVNFFQSLNEDEISIISDFNGPKWQKRKTKIIENLNHDDINKIVPKIHTDSFINSTLNSIRALRLIRAYRINGHLIASLDPLEMIEKNNLKMEECPWYAAPEHLTYFNAASLKNTIESFGFETISIMGDFISFYSAP